MALKNYYELLDIAPSSSADEVKKAFRLQIARYHPDKVQHLGKEFQAMAADRAAELTEAYRILSDEALRADYDRARGNAAAAPAPLAPVAAAKGGAAQESAPAPAAEPAAEPPGPSAGAQFSKERASRDDFVKKAAIGRFRQALAASGTGYDEAPVKGFDMACVPKTKLFARKKGPRLLLRLVSRVDGEALNDTWTQATKWNVPAQEEICVFLLGSSIAPPRELAAAIAEQRKKPARGAKITLIPVDQRDWDAHVPVDAPGVCKSLLAKLKSGS